MDAHHRLDQFRRAAGVADAEAGHRVGLGKAVQKNRALGHAGQRRDAGVLPLKGQLGVNLVGDHEQVVALGQAGDRLERLAGHRAAGGVGGEVQHERLGLGRDCLLDRLGGDGESVLSEARHGHRHAVGQRDAGRVADIARFVVNDLIAGIDDGPQRDVERLADADADEDLRLRIVAHAESPGDVAADGRTQLGQA